MATLTCLLVYLLAGICLPSGVTAQAEQFLTAIWSNRLMLADNQSMTGLQFESLLTDLRIGGHFNATTGCGTAASAKMSSESSANSSIPNSCLTGVELATAHKLNLSAGLSRGEFGSLAVALLQQQLAGRCILAATAGTDESNATKTTRDIKWAYIYGTVSVTIISLLSCIGCILVTCNRAACYPNLMLFLVELAVGSLVGESLLHLLPTVVENGHEEGHGGGGGVPANFLKLVAAAATICILHAVDTGSTVGGLEGHSHDAPMSLEAGQTYSVSTVDQAAAAKPTAATEAAATAEKVYDEDIGFSSGLTQHPPVSIRQLLHHPKLCLRGPVRLCMFVMLSDALHNFADGVAIGAAFSLGDSDGLRLSLSIGLHELAHELADFAVLLSCGFSVRAAVGINFICTATAFVGMFIAVPLAEASSEAKLWILAVAAAMFLYIALVTMTNLVRRSYRPKSTSAFLVGNLGLICGFLSVIAISLYEFFG